MLVKLMDQWKISHMTLIWYINSKLGTRASVSYMKLHYSFETVDWKNFIILRLQLIFVGFILAYHIGKIRYGTVTFICMVRFRNFL